MSQPKVKCENCEALILDETAHKNNGLCVSCKRKHDISIEYKEKQAKRKSNYDKGLKNRKLVITIFVWLFIFVITCGGLFVNYQEYINGKEPRWLSAFGIGVFTFMFILNIYRFFLIFKNMNNEDNT